MYLNLKIVILKMNVSNTYATVLLSRIGRFSKQFYTPGGDSDLNFLEELGSSLGLIWVLIFFAKRRNIIYLVIKVKIRKYIFLTFWPNMMKLEFNK